MDFLKHFLKVLVCILAILIAGTAATSLIGWGIMTAYYPTLLVLSVIVFLAGVLAVAGLTYVNPHHRDWRD